MAQPIELGADLPDLGRDHLTVRDQLILPLGARGGATGNSQHVTAVARQRHPVFIDPAQLVDFAFFNERGGLQDFLRGDAG